MNHMLNNNIQNILHHGLFISFEGIDGAGKSTHIAELAQAFKTQGRTVTLTREPGGTPLAEKLRTMILNDAMEPLSEALLIFAARHDHLTQVIMPALLRGDVVLCDRFTDATFAYQGAGRGFDLEILNTLEKWVQAELQPHLTVWFDLPAQEAAVRLKGTRIPDRFESQPLEFFNRVSGGYMTRQHQHPDRFARINAFQSREAVWHAVQQVFIQKGWLN